MLVFHAIHAVRRGAVLQRLAFLDVYFAEELFVEHARLLVLADLLLYEAVRDHQVAAHLRAPDYADALFDLEVRLQSLPAF
jgi:hypothetical protein